MMGHFQDIAKHFKNDMAVFLDREALAAGNPSPFNDAEGAHQDHYQGLYWDSDALHGYGAWGATFTDPESGGRQWIDTSGSPDRNLSMIESQLRLAGILGEQYGYEGVADPAWLRLEKELSQKLESVTIDQQTDSLRQSHKNMDAALAQWIQTKNTLEPGRGDWGHDAKSIPEDIDASGDRISGWVNGLQQHFSALTPEDIHRAAQSIQGDATTLSRALIRGTDLIEGGRVTSPAVFQDWNQVLNHGVAFAHEGSRSIEAIRRAHPGVADYDLGYAAGGLDTAAQVAREQRVRGIRMSIDGPLGEWALNDAHTLGLMDAAGPKEQGRWVGKAAGYGVIEKDSGNFVAVPVPPDFMAEVGKPITLHENEMGAYTRRTPKYDIAQTRILAPSKDVVPDSVTQWTGNVLHVAKDGRDMHIKATAKVTRVILNDTNQKLPDVAPGTYGKISVDRKTGVVGFQPIEIKKAQEKSVGIA
ncbi:hypothetical protein JKG47_02815 [Acidithiobacillus sp. MC6.1]|nr:hypothetical protein [Acidithiobacillus sp. MC6.1]